MSIQPLFDNVLIEPQEAEERTVSGIYLPDSAKEKPHMGKIMAAGKGKVGPKGEVHPMAVNVGDVVVYKEWGGNKVKIDGKDYVIVSQEEILAVVK